MASVASVVVDRLARCFFRHCARIPEVPLPQWKRRSARDRVWTDPKGELASSHGRAPTRSFAVQRGQQIGSPLGHHDQRDRHGSRRAHGGLAPSRPP